MYTTTVDDIRPPRVRGRAKDIMLKNAHCLLAGLMLPVCLFAGWGDQAPAPINFADNPGNPNVHYNSGGRRIVRINNTTLAICPYENGSERIFRSTNNGVSWEMIDADGRYSGSLISGPDSMVYHFYCNRGGGSIHMVRFKYNATVIPAPQPVYANAAITQSAVFAAEYQALNAGVDSLGNLYVTTNWGLPRDRIYILRSSDGGTTWHPLAQGLPMTIFSRMVPLISAVSCPI